MSQLSVIESELDQARIPHDVSIGGNLTADRVAWLIERNALNERTATERFKTFAVEFGILQTLKDTSEPWFTVDEVHERLGYGERDEVKLALNYLADRGLIQRANNPYKGDMFTARDAGITT